MVLCEQGGGPEACMLLLSGQGLYSQAIVISALEGFRLLDCLIGLS